jgi:hypothetical protein
MDEWTGTHPYFFDIILAFSLYRFFPEPLDPEEVLVSSVGHGAK